MKQRTLVLLVVSALVALPAWAGKRHKNKPEDTDATNQQTATSAVPASYVIAPEDVLDVEVWGNQQLSRQVPVRPDGKISLPLINDVKAAGLTATELANSITDQLKKFVTDPEVTVIVTGVNSQHIYIMGEVNHSGIVPLVPDMRVLQALSSAGGFTPFANPKKIYVLRNGVQHPFNYKDVIKGKNLDENILLQPGDTIVVP